MSVVIVRDPAPPLLSLPDGPAERSAPEAPGHEAPLGEGAGAFAAVLRSLARAIEEGESVTRSALSTARAGRALGPAELIALQAGIYRYGEAVDLTSRLVDRATGAVKAVVQGS